MRETLQKISSTIIESLENYFYRHGKFVSSHPLMVIMSSMMVCGLCGVGLMSFSNETNMVKLWIPQNSDFVRNMNWLWDENPIDASYRFNSLILRGENVLTPAVIQAMFKTHQEVTKIKTSSGATWEDTCLKLPVVKVDELMSRKRRKRDDFFGDDFEDELFLQNHRTEFDTNSSSDFDPSVALYPDIYCPVVEAMPQACFEKSLLEMWGDQGVYSRETEERIESLTQQEIINTVNLVDQSGIFLTKENFTQYLSGIERNSSGHIVAATGTFMRWFGLANTSAISEADAESLDMGFDIPVDSTILEFESELLSVLSLTCHLPSGVESAASVMRQYGDVSSDAIWGDALFLTCGYFIIYGFVQAVLGKWNRVEQRAALAAVGISSTGLAICASWGICSAAGLSYGPMHSLIPCLLVGLGIDDMFVLVQSWDNLGDMEGVTLAERVGKAMRHAGLGITVTSVTDVLVFMIGGTTVLPSLRSYSIFTGVGICFTYFLQITFFLAWFSIDQKRIDEKRDGMFWWKKHPAMVMDKEKSILRRSFSRLGKILQNIPIKVAVLVASLGLLSVSAWGFSNISVELNYVGFLPSDSQLFKWFTWDEEMFPKEGELGHVYLGQVDLPQELSKLDGLVEQFEKHTDVIKSVTGWYPAFKEYVNTHFRSEYNPIPYNQIEGPEFDKLLTQFLFSPNGSRFQNNFKFNGTLKCGEPAPPVLVSSIEFSHPKFETGPRGEHVRAMRWVKEKVAKAQFNTTAFAMAQAYSRWEIDEVISSELLRNVLLALVMVSITTLFLLADFMSCFLVLLFLIMTLVDVLGLMYFWGMTIDIVAGTNIIISVGLCVDYSAHIAHSFLTKTGSGNQRMQQTLTEMGPAVFNGGFSTLLAILMLVNSKSYVFISFFKIFFLMIVVGLFHGLVVLPTALSIFCPAPYTHYINIATLKPEHTNGNALPGNGFHKENNRR